MKNVNLLVEVSSLFQAEGDGIYEVALIKFLYNHQNTERTVFEGILAYYIGLALLGSTLMYRLKVDRRALFEKLFHDKLSLRSTVIRLFSIKTEFHHCVKVLHQLFGASGLQSCTQIINHFTLSACLLWQRKAKEAGEHKKYDSIHLDHQTVSK